MDCPRCGHDLSEPPPPFCPQCGAPTTGGEAPGPRPPAEGERPQAPVVTFIPPPPEPPPIGGPPRDGPPWERRSSFFDLGAWGRTIAGVLFDPPATFRTMKREGGVIGPLLFYWPLALVFTWIALAMTVAWRWMRPDAAGDQLDQLLAQLGIDPERMIVAQVVLSPVFSVLIWFIWSGIAHLFLMMVGGARQSFETTLRVMAYAMGATAPLQIIPMCGWLIGLVWALVVEIIGLAEAHETSTGRAAAAVLLPLILCCLCVCAASVALTMMGIRLFDGLQA